MDGEIVGLAVVSIVNTAAEGIVLTVLFVADLAIANDVLKEHFVEQLADNIIPDFSILNIDLDVFFLVGQELEGVAIFLQVVLRVEIVKLCLEGFLVLCDIDVGALNEQDRNIAQGRFKLRHVFEQEE